MSSLIKITVFFERGKGLYLRLRIYRSSRLPGTDLECTHSISINEGGRGKCGDGDGWLDTQSKGMGKSYTRVYVIERGLAIYIAIGVVIIVNRAPVRERGRRRECKREPEPAKDGVYTRPRTRSLVRVEQRLRGRRAEGGGGGNETSTHRRFSKPLHLRLSILPPRSIPSPFLFLPS